MVITFLPYPDFLASARILDKKRLGQQRREVLMILAGLEDPVHRLYNYPAAKMWRGYPDALVAYGLTICNEWMSRGGEDNLSDIIEGFQDYPKDVPQMPLWFGRDSVHSSHRASLLSKDYDYYRHYGWKEFPNIHYVWPLNEILAGTLKRLRARDYEPITAGMCQISAVQYVDRLQYAARLGQSSQKTYAVVGCDELYFPCITRPKREP